MSRSGGRLGWVVLMAAAEAAAVPPPHVLADSDPDNDFVVAPPAPLADCESRLREAGVEFAPAALPVKLATRQRPTCGIEQAVVYKRGPAKIRYNSAPVLSCSMALGLARFEQVLSQEAERQLGQPIVRIEQGGTYNCRKMARFDLVSEHSYANAIDIRSVTLTSGRKLTVLGTFGQLQGEPTGAEARFWRDVTRRVYDEGTFSVVITPFFDGLHKDHIHLDQARYRVDGTRPAG
ncbi:MAG: hypothetical protein EOO73_07670 [Myxococcales bacterium]|nr:MAG: hypothetical protein EOO73_07670 [Myxococcales bacterium]